MMPTAEWLVEALIGASLLMVLVLVVRRTVARLWGAHMAYALWALPAVRMLMPAIPGWQSLYVPVAGARPDGSVAAALMPPADAALYTQPLLRAPVAEPGLVADWPALLLVLWAAGALAFIAIQWARHLRFVGRAVGEGELLRRVGGVEVVVSAHVPGPMAAGIWRRRVLLPADFMARYSPAERRLALLHEAAHHDRFDLLANLAGLVVLAAHWWNPIAHAAWRAFRSDQELACDATVLAGSDGNTRAAYAGALLKSACVATPIAACAMNHKRQLKERIAMMKDRKHGLSRRLIGAMTVAGLAAGGLIATASGAQPAPPVPPVPPAAAVPTVPPAPPAPPEAPRVMIFTQKLDGKRGKSGKDEKTVVRTIIMKDAKTVSDTGAGGETGPQVMMFGADDKPGAAGEGDVQVTSTADGRKMLLRIDTARLAGGAAEAAQARLAAMRADMRARCEQEGIKVPAEADMAELATCGMELQKKQREAMALARTAIETTSGLSAEQRAQALKGIDAAMANTRQQIFLFKK
jgi:bla regulator protein blaR1